MSRVTMLAFDAGNPALVRRWSAGGYLPHFADLIARSRSAPVENEPGLFVGAVWPTLLTGTGVDRHGCYTGIRPAPFEYHYIADGVHADPLWVDVADAGRRVLVVDPPAFAARADIQADQLIEWGCHDRYYGPHSEPAELLADVLDRVGRHPIGMLDHEHDRLAPCDWIERSEGRRSDPETERFVDVLHDALRHRAALASVLAERGPYDLAIEVVGESHCAGHHLWHLHDPAHPMHDAAVVRRLGGDPLLAVYRQLDDLLGQRLAATTAHDSVFVLLSHGMQSHFDGTLLLDEVLHRLEQRYLGRPTPWIGPRSGAIGRVPPTMRASMTRWLGPLVRRRMADRATQTDEFCAPPPGERLWYQLENNTVTGAVRFNRVGREPNGLLGTGLVAHATRWLERELTALVNADTGGRVVASVEATSTRYVRRDEDGLPDLLVEWIHDAPVDRVWSPTIGLVSRPYRGFRSGDHTPTGELFVLGPGIEPGRRETIRAIDVAPTVAASVDVALADRDGRVVADLVPGARRPQRGAAAVAQRVMSPAAHGGGGDGSAVTDEVSALRREVVELRRQLNGLAAAHHETRRIAVGRADEPGTQRGGPDRTEPFEDSRS